jgi:hypothetical protein
MRMQERDFIILAWVDHEGFPHLEEITKALFKKGSNPMRAPYRRMLMLREEGLIDTVKIATDPRERYVITRKGVSLLRSVGFQYVPGVSKKKSLKNYEHDGKLTHLRIFFQELGLAIWIPERVIRSMKRRGRVPDAFLITWGANYAIEYEWSKKEIPRYKQIFERYATKEKYNGVLYILPTESRIKWLWEAIPLIDKKIYFVSEEKLYSERENAVFHSSYGDSLPLKHLIQHSLKAPLEEMDPQYLKEIIQSELPDAWKDKKPFIPFGGGGSRKDEEGHDSNSEEDGESSIDPSVDPPVNPKEDRDSEHNESEVDRS